MSRNNGYLILSGHQNRLNNGRNIIILLHVWLFSLEQENLKLNLLILYQNIKIWNQLSVEMMLPLFIKRLLFSPCFLLFSYLLYKKRSSYRNKYSKSRLSNKYYLSHLDEHSFVNIFLTWLMIEFLFSSRSWPIVTLSGIEGFQTTRFLLSRRHVRPKSSELGFLKNHGCWIRCLRRKLSPNNPETKNISN